MGDTIEERIEAKLKDKSRLFDEVIEGLADVDLRQTLTEEELFGLFGLKPPRMVAEEKARSGWQQIDAAGFERLVASLYEKMGYAAKVTQRTRDGGIDIESWRQQATGPERVLIQCKHWPDGMVGENHVRDLYGALSARQDVDRAELVTSGGISRDARRWAQGKRLRLVDGVELRMLLSRYGL
jgi:restriction system protein